MRTTRRNSTNPPLYLDLPYKNGELQQDVINKWAANAPSVSVDQYIRQLKRYRGIALDVGIRISSSLMLRNCTKCWINTGLPFALRFIPALIPARSRTVSRIT